MNVKAAKEAFTELCRVADEYDAIYARYKHELLMYGTISKEALALRREIDKRAERIYK